MFQRISYSYPNRLHQRSLGLKNCTLHLNLQMHKFPYHHRPLQQVPLSSLNYLDLNNTDLIYLIKIALQLIYYGSE